MAERQASIVTIYGEDCDPRRASDDVVRVLEDALERARSGELIAIAFAGLHHDRSTATCRAGMYACSAMIGAAYCVLQDVERETR